MIIGVDYVNAIVDTDGDAARVLQFPTDVDDELLLERASAADGHDANAVVLRVGGDETSAVPGHRDALKPDARLDEVIARRRQLNDVVDGADVGAEYDDALVFEVGNEDFVRTPADADAARTSAVRQKLLIEAVWPRRASVAAGAKENLREELQLVVFRVTDEDLARRVDGDVVRKVQLRPLRSRSAKERQKRRSLRLIVQPEDLDAVVIFVDDVDEIVCVDDYAGRQFELAVAVAEPAEGEVETDRRGAVVPFVAGGEHLDAVVAPVGDEDASAPMVSADAPRSAELAGVGAGAAELQDDVECKTTAFVDAVADDANDVFAGRWRL